MIRIVLTKENGEIKKVEIKGHAGYAKYGRDIVCSAVSGIACTALLGLIDISTQTVEYVKEEGYLVFSVPQTQDAEERIKINAILRAMELGLKDVQEGYRAFVKMEE